MVVLAMAELVLLQEMPLCKQPIRGVAKLFSCRGTGNLIDLLSRNQPTIQEGRDTPSQNSALLSLNKTKVCFVRIGEIHA
jgi:hypothetical protein